MYSQQNHFIYLQTEDKQPFYVKLDSKVLSSSASGYLIIPKLQDGMYSVGIGFPLLDGQQFFNCVINKKDIGYVIKNSGNNKWQLVNMQTQKVLVPGEVIFKSTPVVQETVNDAFSTMLANAVHDSTILQKDIIEDVVKETLPQKNEEKLNTDTIQLANVPQDSIVLQKDSKENKDEKEKVKVEEMQQLAKADAGSIQNSIITKQLQNASVEGIEMIFFDEYNNIRDTIRIFIPAEKEIKKELQKIAVDSPAQINTVINDDVIVKVDQPSADIQMQIPENKTSQSKNKEPVFIESKMINSDCKNFATEDDFLKIRKKMVTETNDEDMVKVAKKFFKSRCFTTEQIKNLSVLFLKDEGKYLFFDVAYPFVSNSDVYGNLEAQLSDPYYISRFRAMIHK